MQAPANTLNDTVVDIMPAEAGATVKPAAVRVMVIDDNEEFCHIIKEMLDPLGYQVQTITNPVKALELYTRVKESIELVILDYYMPGLDGAQTFEWLRKLNPNVKVILCSGIEGLRLRQLQARHAIDGFIAKPFHIQEALHVIRKVMGSRVPKSA